MTPSLRYHPFYCEENAWWLAQDKAFEGREPHIVFVSNKSRQCLFCNQKAAGIGEPIIWDYHVFIAVQAVASSSAEKSAWEIWDPDTRLGLPIAASNYFEGTFPEEDNAGGVPESVRPSFRVIAAKRFVESFSTDRSHMRSESGEWLQSPPPWDPPQVPGAASAMNLMRFVDMTGVFEGDVMSLSEVRQRFG